jgi:hypothetical protein
MERLRQEVEAFCTRTPRDQTVRTRHFLSAVTNDAIEDTARYLR